jgi:hypothetical protein
MQRQRCSNPPGLPKASELKATHHRKVKMSSVIHYITISSATNHATYMTQMVKIVGVIWVL